MSSTKRVGEDVDTVSKKTKIDTNMACSPSSAVEKWQDNCLAETNLRMLEDKIMCDVTFLVGGKREPVPAHKFMLVSRSPVFFAMFCGPLAETQSEILIPDVEVDILKSLLRFLYTEWTDITNDTVMATLYAARKYEVWQLERECWDFLDRYIDEENACAILQQAVDFDEKTSIESSLSYILDHEEKVMESQGFLLLSKEALRMILDSDEIFLDELSIYQACLKWAKYQLSEVGKPTTDQAVRESLGELINLIRFPLMSQKEFTKHVSNTNILTAEEKVAVFQSNILRKDTGEGPVSCRERCVKVDWVIERFTNVECDWVHRNDYNSVSFTCSKNVRLIGVILFTPSKPGAIEGALKLVDSNYKELFLKTSNLNTIQ